MIPLILALALQDEGFEKIFNDKDLAGWKFHGVTEKSFEIKDGTIVCSGKPAGYLYTEKSYKKFTLRFDWRYKRPEKLEDDRKFPGNSGYLLYVQEHKVWPKSLEIQGMNRDAGYIIPISMKAKWDTDKEGHKLAVKPVGEWNAMEIVAKDTITSFVNGVKISVVTECELSEGPIAFQSEGAEIHWRNIRIREEK
jgi:hypothetical protein